MAAGMRMDREQGEGEKREREASPKLEKTLKLLCASRRLSARSQVVRKGCNYDKETGNARQRSERESRN